MNETNSNWLTNNPCSITATGITTGTSTSITTGYTGTPINGGGGTYISGDDFKINSTGTLTISNSNNMNKQVKVAVFEVSRNEDNKVVSSKLVKELWVEQKNGSSIELAVAKHLDKDFNPENTIIKEIYSVSF